MHGGFNPPARPIIWYNGMNYDLLQESVAQAHLALCE